MSAADSVQIGIVGLGARGQGHAEKFSEQGHAVVAGADVATEARENFAHTHDATVYESYETMYDAEALDAVAVATPTAFHASPAIAALERDIYVLVEKPMTDKLEAAEALLAAERESAAFGMVGFTARFRSSVALFRGLDEEGRFGDLRHVETAWCRTRGIPGIGTWFTQKELSGGGAVMDMGVHIIDRAMYLLDFPAVLEVSAVTRTDFGNRGEDYINTWLKEDKNPEAFDVEDSASAFVRCADGKSLSVEVAWASNRVSGNNGTVIWGTEAGAEITDDGLRVMTVDDVGIDHTVESDLAGEIDPNRTDAQDQLFVESVLANHPPETCTIEQGVEVQRILDGIYRSSEANGAVQIGE